MPNFTERLFRLTLLYAGLVFLVTGLWGIAQAWFAWQAVISQGHDPFYYFITFTVMYAPRPFLGVLLVFRFRRFARKIFSKLSTSSERSQLAWHDTPVFAALLSLVTGLYFLYTGLTALPQNWLTPVVMIAYGGNNLFAIIDTFRQEWPSILLPLFYMSCGLVLCCYTERISAKVTRMVETTPEAESEDQIINDDQTDEGSEKEVS